MKRINDYKRKLTKLGFVRVPNVLGEFTFPAFYIKEEKPEVTYLVRLSWVKGNRCDHWLDVLDWSSEKLVKRTSLDKWFK